MDGLKAINKANLKRLQDQAERMQAERLERAKQETYLNTSVMFSSKIKIDKPLYICPDCGEARPYSRDDDYEESLGSYQYSRERCECEQERYERQQHEAAEYQKWQRDCRIQTLRENSRLEGRLGRLTFDSLRQHPQFEFAMKNGLAKAYKAAVAFAENPGSRGIVFSSPQHGDFKTGLACSIANALILQETKVEFWPVFDLLNEIRSSYDKSEDYAEQLSKRLAKLDVLILDDLGNERIASDERGDWAREQVYSLIYWREVYEKPLIVTTNYTPQELDPKIHGATLSRILGMCDWITIPLKKDYRLKQSARDEAAE